MAEFQTADLGRIIQTSEAIKGLKRQGAEDALRQQYLGVQIGNAKNNETRAQGEYDQNKATADAKQHYLIAQAIETSDDPVAFAKQYAPELVSTFEQQHGPGSFSQVTPDALKQTAGMIKQKNAALAGISLNGTPEQQFAAGQQDKTNAFNRQARLDEIAATGSESRKTEAVKNAGKASSSFSTDEGDLMGALAERGVALPAGLRSRDQMKTTFRALLDRNPDLTADQIADKISTGQIDFNANKKSISTALANFTSGKNGNTIRSINVAVQHLDQLGGLATALNNGDTQLFNRIGNAFAAQTGGTAPTNFEAAKQLVADELVKAIVGTGGGVGDREKADKSISAAGSPQQLAQVIETYQGLLTGQLNGMRQQYKTSTGRDDFEDLLLPETKSRLEHHMQTPQTPTDTPTTNAQGWTLHVDAKGNKAYVSPDGKQFQEVK